MEPKGVCLWLDMNMPQSMKRLADGRADLEIVHIREFGMQRTRDRDIFMRARECGVDALVTKDSDFVLLSAQSGHPPTIVWLRCGNAPAVVMDEILESRLELVLGLIRAGEPLIEIGSPRTE